MREPRFRKWAGDHLSDTGKLMITILSHFLVVAWLVLLVAVGWWMEKKVFPTHAGPTPCSTNANEARRSNDGNRNRVRSSKTPAGKSKSGRPD